MNNCIVARKPLAAGTVAANTLKYHCGSLNIDASRVHSGPSDGGTVSGETALGQGSGWNTHNNRPTQIDRAMPLGRWPANLILQHLDGCVCTGSKQVKPPNGSGITGKGANGFRSDYVGGQKQSDGHNAAQFVDPTTGTEAVANWVCVAGCPVAELDSQSSDMQPSKGQYVRKHGSDHFLGSGLGDGRVDMPSGITDMGGASRFFKQVGGTVLVSEETD